jgi:ABC-2 type transport system ATP-binding protein
VKTSRHTGTSEDVVLVLDGVSRSFSTLKALDNVSFEVRPGRLTGFIGANGAGKTTAMRIILGVLAPDSGTLTWQGAPLTFEVRRDFGYMPEERGLYPKMGVLEQVVYFGRLHGLDVATARQRARDLLEELGLAERANDKLHMLSLGNQQRAQVAAALVHEPTCLVLDEPFSGLDPVAVETMAAILRQRAAAGVPVLFSSHQLDLVERLCDDIVIVDHGRVVAAGQAHTLRQQRAGSRYRIRVGSDAGWLRDVPDVHVIDVEGPTALVDLAGLKRDQDLLRLALSRDDVHEFTRVVPTLAEIYREAVR